MNDITALAQRMKAAAISAKELSIIARYSKGRAAVEAFIALMTPDNVLALVEALVEAPEKAQQQNTSDFEIKARLCKESNSLHDRLREAEKRIAELESRTVTVKLPKAISVLHRRDFIDAHRAIYAYPEAELNAALADAGIQVIEGEGQ